MDFEKYHLKLNIRTACLYEQLSGKSFFKMTGEGEELAQFLYACLMANNESLMMTYQVFLTFIQSEKVEKWLVKEYKRISDYAAQFHEDAPDERGSGIEMTMTEIASSFIMEHHLEPHYVYYEMEFWEISPYIKAADTIKKEALMEQRLWTYLNIIPHIDTKKCKSPEDMLPFEWEAKERRNKAEKQLAMETEAAKNIIGKEMDWIK